MHQLKRTKAEEEERIAAVLQQRMQESERSAKELQQLRNESAELRDLQVTSPPHPIMPTSCITTTWLVGGTNLVVLTAATHRPCKLKKHAAGGAAAAAAVATPAQHAATVNLSWNSDHGEQADWFGLCRTRSRLPRW